MYPWYYQQWSRPMQNYQNMHEWQPYYGYENNAYRNDWNHYYNNSDDDYRNIRLEDLGRRPFVVDIEDAAERNRNYRTTIWTGKHLQVTLMSIPVGGDVGLEVHPTVDQFIRIEEGRGVVQMGDRRNRLDFRQRVSEDDAIMIPAGKWHNLTNTGREPMKLYSIYAPPEHPFGTVHQTKEIAMAAEENR